MTSNNSTHQRGSQQKKGSITRDMEFDTASYSTGKTGSSYHNNQGKNVIKLQNDLSTGRSHNTTESSGNPKRGKFPDQIQTKISDENDLYEAIKNGSVTKDEVAVVFKNFQWLLDENRSNLVTFHKSIHRLSDDVVAIANSFTSFVNSLKEHAGRLDELERTAQHQSDKIERVENLLQNTDREVSNAQDSIMDNQNMMTDVFQTVEKQEKIIKELLNSRDEDRKAFAEQKKVLDEQRVVLDKQQRILQTVLDLQKNGERKATVGDFQSKEKGKESVDDTQELSVSTVLDVLARARSSETIGDSAESWMDNILQRRESKPDESQEQKAKSNFLFDQKNSQGANRNMSDTLQTVLSVVASQQRALLAQQKSISKHADSTRRTLSDSISENIKSVKQKREVELDNSNQAALPWASQLNLGEKFPAEAKEKSLTEVHEMSEGFLMQRSLLMRDAIRNLHIGEFSLNTAGHELGSDVSSGEGALDETQETVETAVSEPSVEKVVPEQQLEKGTMLQGNRDQRHASVAMSENRVEAQESTPYLSTQKAIATQLEEASCDTDEDYSSIEHEIQSEHSLLHELSSSGQDDTESEEEAEQDIPEKEGFISDDYSDESEYEKETQTTDATTADRFADLVQMHLKKGLNFTESTSSGEQKSSSTDRLVVVIRPSRKTAAKGLRTLSKEIRAALGPQSILEMFNRSIVGNLKIYIIRPTDEGINALTNFGVLVSVKSYEDSDLE